MKKLLLVVLVLALLLPAVALGETDYASMTTDQLRTMIDSARNELAKREIVASDDEILLFEQDGVAVYLTGKHEIDWADDMNLEAIVINNSQYTVDVSIDSASVNGLMVDMMGIYETTPGNKKRDGFYFSIEEAGISSFEDIEDIEFNFNVYNDDNYEDIFRPDTITVHFNVK